MSTPTARGDMKRVLRALLTSSPHVITVDQLERDYLLREGHNVPYRELGYATFLQYLESIPDTVMGVSVQTIQQELLSSKLLQKYGMDEDCDVYNLLSHLDHLLKISEGMVYPLRKKQQPYRPIMQIPQTESKMSKIHYCQTQGGAGDVSNQSYSVNVDTKFHAAAHEADNVDAAEAFYKQAKVNEIVEDPFVCTTGPGTVH